MRYHPIIPFPSEPVGTIHPTIHPRLFAANKRAVNAPEKHNKKNVSSHDRRLVGGYLMVQPVFAIELQRPYLASLGA
jgi:hypothetical protein